MRSMGYQCVEGKGGITLKIDIEQLKTLVESGDKAALESHIYKALEKEDVALVQSVNADVRSVIDAEKDRHHSKALDTWKANNLDTLVDAEVKKLNPDKSPAEIELEKLKKQFEDSEKARNREKQMNQAIKTATDKGLPIDLLDYFVSDDEEKTTANLSKLEEVYNKAVQASVDGKFKESGRDVNSGGSGSPSTIKSITEMAAEHNIRNQN